MKKIHLIVQHKDVPVTLGELRELGVVHIEHQRDLKGQGLEKVRSDVQVIERALEILALHKKEVKPRETYDNDEKAREIIALFDEQIALKDAIAKRQILINHWEPWGAFDPKDIDALAQKGITLKLCEIPVSEEMKHIEGVIVEPVFEKGGVARSVVIMREEQELEFETVSLPQEGLKQMRKNQAADQAKVKELEEKIADANAYADVLKAGLAKCQDALMFEEAAAGLQEEGRLSLLKGFCPKDVVAKLEEAAKQHHWGLTVEDVADDDQVPTLLRNPKWVSIIDPVLKMINIVPGFEEFDVSFLFLIFFTLFFGMLIGDAGYGLVFLLLTAFAQFKTGKNTPDKTGFILMYVLSAVTIVYGGLTATFFGQKWLTPYVKPLVPWLNDTDNVQKLCFLIGAIHLSIAHLWCAVKKWPSLELVRDVGWFLIIWVMFFMTRVLVLGATAPGFLLPLLIVAVVLILFVPKFKMAPTFPLDVINCFTDVVSYIRLFAVGLATVAVADAANEMSIGWVIFLHVLNILLAAMAILVHGLRLNVLEFSGHLGMEWAGFAYRPFKKQASIINS